MPTYQYACTNCDHRFDAVQAFSDASLTECPQCTGRLRKLYGAVGIVFKGSGFYRTDSRRNGDDAESSKASKSESTKDDSSTKNESSSKSDSGTKNESSSNGSKTSTSTSSSSSATSAAS